jgi:hypothetical protein
MMVVLDLMIARLPFREWSKIDSDFPESWDDFFRVVGLGILGGCAWMVGRNGVW